MITTYSENPVHKFLKEFVSSKKGLIDDSCEDYFTITYPSSNTTLKYTYRIGIAKEKHIDLIAKGTPVFNEIIDECLKDGIVCPIVVTSKSKIDEVIRNFFKDEEYHCDNCETISTQDKDVYVCNKLPTCYHKVNNTKISKIEIVDKSPVKLVQFYYNAIFNSRLKRNEEFLSILLDENGKYIEKDILHDSNLHFEDFKEEINVSLFDKLYKESIDVLDTMLINKKAIFDLQLKDEIDSRLHKLKIKLKDEELQSKIKKNSGDYDEDEWDSIKKSALSHEKKSLETFVTVTLLNVLIIRAYKIKVEIKFENNAILRTSFVLGIDRYFKTSCPFCRKEFLVGYGTEDGYYVCSDCINQSIETKKIYSNKYKLNRDNTTNEHIEEDKGFICTVCGKQHSKLFEFLCKHDASKVCYQCFEYCSKCKDIFSLNNLKKSKNTSKLYCPNHIYKCDNCKEYVGIDEIKVCPGTGLSLCSCTKFSNCSICDQEYSASYLRNGKCIACNNLIEEEDQAIISIVTNHDQKAAKTKRWLIGQNKLNTVVITKGVFSDYLFVVKENNVVATKKLSLATKIRGF
jgi:hypothetical protein